MSVTGVAFIERGETQPSLSSLEKISRALGVLPAELLEGPLADHLSGWLQAALTEDDFVRRFNAAKASLHSAETFRDEEDRALEELPKLKDLKEAEAPPAQVRAAYRDRAVAKAKLTAAGVLYSELLLGRDVSNLDALALVARIVHTQDKTLTDSATSPKGVVEDAG